MLKFMAAGLPVITNPTGEAGKLVRNAKAGLLAATPAEWVEAVRRLAADPSLRRRLGQAGRQVIERHYADDAVAEKWMKTLGLARADRQAKAA